MTTPGPVWQPPGPAKVICWKCEKVIAEAPTYDEACVIAEEEFDAMCDRGDEGSGEWIHQECYNAYVAEMMVGFPTSRRAREQEQAYRSYMAEAEYDPVSAYLRAKGEL